LDYFLDRNHIHHNIIIVVIIIVINNNNNNNNNNKMLSRSRVLLSKLQPLGDRVLVKRLEAMTKTAGGILLPESNVSKANEGQIIAVGPGMKTKNGDVIPITVAVGDKVLLPEYGGLPVKVNGDEMFLFRNEEILAKII